MADPPARDFGAYLRQERERRGISLHDIAATTKISMMSLEALERNQINRLPGGVFTRAFVRTYAAHIGLDPERTVEEFLDRFPTVQRPERAQVSPHEGPAGASAWNRQRVTVGLIILLGLAAILALGLFAGGVSSIPSGAPEAVMAPAAR